MKHTFLIYLLLFLSLFSCNSDTYESNARYKIMGTLTTEYPNLVVSNIRLDIFNEKDGEPEFDLYVGNYTNDEEPIVSLISNENGYFESFFAKTEDHLVLRIEDGYFFKTIGDNGQTRYQNYIFLSETSNYLFDLQQIQIVTAL